MQLRLSLITLSACGALALALGACTHSDDDPPATDETMMEPTPVAVDMSGVSAGAAVETGSFTLAAGMSTTRGDVTYSCPAGGDACAVTVMADRTATSTGGTATATNSATYQAKVDAEGERDDLQDEKDREQARMDLAAAKELFAALRMPVAIAGDPEEGGATNGQVGATARDTQVTLPALEDAMKDGNFSGKMGTAEYSAVVMSTKEPDSTKLFAEVHSGPRFQDGIFSFDAADPAASKLIESPRFPQEAGERSYGPAERQFAGTYQGASGTYACAGDDCKAKWTTGGIDLSAGWTFTPSDGARVVVSDGNFQSYGWWLQKNENGTVDAGPVHFTTGTAFAASNVTGLEGSATYEGSAAGKYAIYSGAFSERSEAGHFTADAMLKANFGNATDNGRVSGMIDNFMTEAGAKSDWMVSLEASGAGLADGLSDAGAFNGSTVWTIGSVSSDDDDGKGRYSGSLYDVSDRPGGDGVPFEAGGTFDAKFEVGVGQMVGSFAATRETQ